MSNSADAAGPHSLQNFCPPVLVKDIQLQPVANLRALGREARTHSAAQINMIARGIQEFGFLVPLLLDECGRVVAGNGRLRAARQLGMDEAPCIIVSHLSHAQKRAYVLLDNRASELAGWDDDTLNKELSELRALDLDFDLELTGFNKIEIEARSVVLLDDDGEDACEPPPQTSIVRPGDIWRLGEHLVGCFDSTLPASYAALLQGERARVVCTDPPYNVPVRGHVTSSKLHREFAMASGEMTDEQFSDFLKTAMDLMGKQLIDGGLLYVFMDWRHSRHVLGAAHQLQLELMNTCVWNKGRAGQGSFYRSKHEFVHVLKSGTAPHLNRIQLGRHGRDRSNVWDYPGVTGRGKRGATDHADHPTPKCVAMLRDLLLDSTEPRDIALDPFGGGGSLLIAAEQIGRRARVLELDAIYVTGMINRWRRYTGGEAILTSTGETAEEVVARRAAEAGQPPPPDAGQTPSDATDAGPVRVRRRVRPSASGQE